MFIAAMTTRRNFPLQPQRTLAHTNANARTNALTLAQTRTCSSNHTKLKQPHKLHKRFNELSETLRRLSQTLLKLHKRSDPRWPWRSKKSLHNSPKL